MSSLDRPALASGNLSRDQGTWERLAKRSRFGLGESNFDLGNSSMPICRAGARFLDCVHRQSVKPVAVVHANLTQSEQELNAELQELRHSIRLRVTNAEARQHETSTQIREKE